MSWWAQAAGWRRGSAGAADLLGYRAKDILGHPATDLWHNRPPSCSDAMRQEPGNSGRWLCVPQLADFAYGNLLARVFGGEEPPGSR